VILVERGRFAQPERGESLGKLGGAFCPPRLRPHSQGRFERRPAQPGPGWDLNRRSVPGHRCRRCRPADPAAEVCWAVGAELAGVGCSGSPGGVSLRGLCAGAGPGAVARRSRLLVGRSAPIGRARNDEAPAGSPPGAPRRSHRGRRAVAVPAAGVTAPRGRRLRGGWDAVEGRATVKGQRGNGV
jgi:hypothetical protein